MIVSPGFFGVFVEGQPALFISGFRAGSPTRGTSSLGTPAQHSGQRDGKPLGDGGGLALATSTQKVPSARRPQEPAVQEVGQKGYGEEEGG